ncbi:MAG: glycosyltransferase family 4 protein [Anaerolineae bacterium]|nr:glycosyltransferase family 4 protein [Anaerolineae bacterium]
MISGQTTHVLSLSKELVLRGHDVTVIFPDAIREAHREFNAAGIKVIILPMGKLIWPMQSMREFMRVIQQERFEIIHVHSQEAGIIARWLSKVGNAPNIFYTPQTIDIRQRRWHKLYMIFERMFAGITTQIFSVSQVDAARMISWGIPAKKIQVVPNGIDLTQFDNLEARDTICGRLSLRTNRPVILQIGRLSPQKDPLMFLKGAGLIVSGNSEVQLVWIGEGPLYDHVKTEVASLQLQENIFFLGRIEKAYRYIPAADVVTSTSRWEGLPYSILEAMACSKPVVSTAVNGCAEAVIDGSTGYLVDAGDVNGWAESVLRLIAHPDQAKSMGNSGRKLLEEQFTLSRMVTQIEQTYTDYL